MAGQDDDGESGDALKAELTEARDNLRRQIEIIDAGPLRRRSGEDGQLRADLADQLEQIEAELAKYADETAPADDTDPDGPNDVAPGVEPAPEPEPEEANDPKPVVSPPIEFHTDAPDGPPENGQFWVFAGMGVVGLLALTLLLRIFSMLWAHLMGHPAG